MVRSRLTATVLFGCALAFPAAAGEVPDFSGPWGRNMFNFEPPDSGPGPIVNLRRLGADAGRSVVDGDPIPLVGDYRNAILKPEAAAVVRILRPPPAVANAKRPPGGPRAQARLDEAFFRGYVEPILQKRGWDTMTVSIESEHRPIKDWLPQKKRREVIYLTKDGQAAFAVVPLDEGDREILAMRKNKKLMAHIEELTRLALEGPRKSLADVKKKYGIK